MDALLSLALILSLLAPQQGALPEDPSGGGRVERRLAAMGTWLEVSVRASERSAALTASEAAVRAIENVEARLSTWRDDSELSLLNQARVGHEVTLSPALAADLARAQDFWRRTEGAFDPGLGALVAAWGLRTGGRRPTAQELAEARATSGMRGFELAGRRAVRLHPRAAFEEGGFGKGVGLDAALAALVDAPADARADAAVLDLGGQLAVLGESVPVRLADPRARESAVLELDCAPGSFATSGNSERGILVDGVARGHVLDPRTGEPAEDFGSLSVWALDATTADCLSTGLYVLGPERALAWQRANREVEILVLESRDGRLRATASAGLRGRLRALVPGLELSFDDQESVPSSDNPSSPPTPR